MIWEVASKGLARRGSDDIAISFISHLPATPLHFLYFYIRLKGKAAEDDLREQIGNSNVLSFVGALRALKPISGQL